MIMLKEIYQGWAQVESEVGTDEESVAVYNKMKMISYILAQ